MNILSFTQIPKFININNTNKKEYKYSTLSLNTLKQDTVSFQGSTVTDFREIEELKKMNSAGHYDFKLSKILLICSKYFGYTVEDGEHIKLTGPYGQVTMIDNKTPVDAGCAKDFIEAIQRVDEYNGELIFFPKIKTQEDMDYWKKKVHTEEPINGTRNLYAEKLKKVRQAEQEIKIKKEQKATNEEIKVLREKLALFNLASIEEKLEKLTDRFRSAEKEFKENKSDIPQEDIKEIEKVLNAKLNEINKIKEIENKLNKNQKLTKEEKLKLSKFIEQKFDLQSLETLIETFETSYLLQLEKKESLIAEIKSSIDEFFNKNNQNLIALQEIESTVKAKKINILRAGKDESRVKIKQHIKKIKENLTKLEKYRTIDSSKLSPSQLEGKIEKLKILSSETAKLYQELKQVFIQEIASVVIASADLHVNADKTVTTEKSLDSASMEEVKNVAQLDNTHNTQNQVIEDFQLLELKSRMATRWAPLPIRSVIKEVHKLVDDKFDIERFKLIEDRMLSSQDFMIETTKNVATSEEYKTIRNAAKFALLDCVYNLSENPNDEIYSLKSKQLIELYNAIKNGQTNILIQSENQPININLEKSPNLDDIENKFNEFNSKINTLEMTQIEKITGEILKYAPRNMARKELKQVREILLEEASYYKLLLSDNLSEGMTKKLLSTFWNKYKNITGKDYVDDVMANYQQTQEEKQAAIMHQIKLKSIEEIDWTL